MSCEKYYSVALLIVISQLFPFIVNAQDAHYWQSSYSPGALLTPGATIVNDKDSGVYYINPALTALHPRNAARISGNLYQVRSTRVRDGIGTAKPLSSTNVGIVPVLVSGTIFFGGTRTIVFGYSLVHDAVSSYYVNQRKDARMQLLDDAYSPGPEFYVGQYSSRNHISNTRASGSVAVKLNKHWAIGLTLEAGFRSQNFAEQYTSRALINAPDSILSMNPMTNVSSDYQLRYWNAGMGIKTGISFESGRHHVGMLLSSPRINLKGNATIASDLVITDLHLLPGPGDPPFNLLANGRQTSLPVKYKDPWSIALGYAMDYERGQVQVIAAYFGALKKYNIITPGPQSFIRPDTGTNKELTSGLLQFNEQRRSVLNVAVGWKHRLSDLLTGYASFSTDVNYAKNADPINSEFTGYHPTTSKGNLYHFNLGVNIPRRKANLHAGLLITYGTTNSYPQPVNFDSPDESNLLLGERQHTSAKYFSAGLLLGYLFNL